ncbi:MAG: hypothetical protein J6P72_09715 [Firmicutes bacterium]|nr:hypothetical protein [Bacillota bacterium]
MKDELREQLEALFADENAVNAFQNCSDVDEAIRFFSEKGIRMTEADLEEIAAMATSDGELSEDNLEDVAGGLLVTGPVLLGPVIISVIYKLIRRKKR